MKTIHASPRRTDERSALRDGYESFSYLEAGTDYTAFGFPKQLDRVERYDVPLSDEQEERFERLQHECIKISLHDHLCVFPDPIAQTPHYVREGRVVTAFDGLIELGFDAVFDALLDGLCRIESMSGWKWNDVLHDLGMRLCDLGHQDLVILARRVEDIRRAHRENKIAWIVNLEGAAMIENELDRIEILYGLGVRSMGVTYSEANALGSGLKEPNDSGLSVFGRKAVERMNNVGMLIDCAHAGDRTTLDTIEASSKPIVISHIGARALWDSNRLAPDEVIKACAERGGLIGIEAAPHTTITWTRPEHTIDAYMEHFEYVKDLVGIDHVGFGPDTVYGDHVGLHHVYAEELSIKEAVGPAPQKSGEDFPRVEYVRGLENPTEASHNIFRWLVKHGYSDDEIQKAIGGNALRLLEDVWY